MRHGGQRSRRFMRREEMRRAHRLLVALGRKARRERSRKREELTREERLTLVYAFRYALKQRLPGLDNVQAAMEPHLHEFKPGTLVQMATDIDVHWSVTALAPERHTLTRKEQEAFRAMLMREIERRMEEYIEKKMEDEMFVAQKRI